MLLEELTDDQALEILKTRNLRRMKLRKVNAQPFADTTEMPFYDDLMRDPHYAKREGYSASIQHLRPSDYIWKCAEGFKSSVSSLERTRSDTGKIQDFVSLLKNGNQLPTPVLDYSNGKFRQEGLHRAFAAKEIGLEKIPVLVVEDAL